jgi:hypothetical protein
MQRASRSLIKIAATIALVASSPSTGSSYPQGRPESLQPFVDGSEPAEVTLARSGGPPAISSHAQVLVFSAKGYRVASKGTNSFVCLVMRSWSTTTDDEEFWNPKIRQPACFNAAGARSVLAVYLERTRWVLAGKSKPEIAEATKLEVSRHRIPRPQPGAMCFMMSRQGYLGDILEKHPHPHLMFFYAGMDGSTLGANLPAVPIHADDGRELNITTFFILVPKWSDGTFPDGAQSRPAAR